MSERHGIRITPDTIELVTFLNDGDRPEIQEDNFLIIEVHGPNEITTKIMTLDEVDAKLHSDELHVTL
jgi:hypothetical protein